MGQPYFPLSSGPNLLLVPLGEGYVPLAAQGLLAALFLLHDALIKI